MSIDPTLAKIQEALDEFSRSGELDKVAAPATPPASPDAGFNAGGNVYMSVSDKYELQRRLVQKSVPELHAIFADQASRKPGCRAAEMVATGMLEEIANAPFDS